MSLLGRDTTTNKNVFIDQNHRTRGMYIIGATGSGKSVLVEQLAVTDAIDGLGFCVLDPHGDLINNILLRLPPARKKDVILLDPTDAAWPFGLNLFSCSNPHDPLTVELAVNQITHVFEKIFGMSYETPRLAQFIRTIAYTLVGTEYTICEIPYLLQDKNFRERVVANTTLSTAKLFWKSFGELRTQEQLERSESTLNRIDSLTSNQIIRCIVGQSKTTLNFREIMDTGKILLVSLNAQLDAMTNLLGSIITGQILLAALSRADTKKRRQFNFYVDEFQRFATPDMGTLLVEARKYDIATTVAHQVREQLDKENQSKVLQAGSLIVFRVNSTDAIELAPNFDTSPPVAEKPPGTTPADILNDMTDHPDEEVKTFWTIFVKPLLDAKSLTPRTPLRRFASILEDYPYPYFMINEEKVYFDPQLGRELLDPLQRLFYNASVNRGDNAELFKRASMLLLDAVQGNKPLFKRDEFFNFFADSLKLALYHVYLKPIERTSTEWQSNFTNQQTHSQRRDEIANQLTHLEPQEAMVKVPFWDKEALKTVIVEHTIKTTPRYIEKKLLTQENIQKTRREYLEQNHGTYCRPRKEVEEEIRKRTELPNPPTTRTHQV